MINTKQPEEEQDILTVVLDSLSDEEWTATSRIAFKTKLNFYAALDALGVLTQERVEIKLAGARGQIKLWRKTPEQTEVAAV